MSFPKAKVFLNVYTYAKSMSSSSDRAGGDSDEAMKIDHRGKCLEYGRLI